MSFQKLQLIIDNQQCLVLTQISWLLTMCFDATWTQCPNLIDTPMSSMCCMSDSTCMPISNGTDTIALICCSDDQGCPTLAPIPCDLQLQNDTATPTGVIKTVDFSPLEPCAGQCCPHGYSCNGTLCALNGDQFTATAPASPSNSPVSINLSQSSSLAPTTTLTAMYDPTTTLGSASSSLEPPSSLVIDTSMVSRPLSSQPVQTAMPMDGSASGASQATVMTSSESQNSQDQSYKKLILPITLSAVATWLILVFVAWKVLKRRERKLCEAKKPKIYFETPPVPAKEKRKWSTMPKFELADLPRFFELPTEREAFELPATPVRSKIPKSPQPSPAIMPSNLQYSFSNSVDLK